MLKQAEEDSSTTINLRKATFQSETNGGGHIDIDGLKTVSALHRTFTHSRIYNNVQIPSKSSSG